MPTAADYLSRGNAKFDAGDYDGAMEDYTQALRLKPDDALAFYNRGVTKAKLGDYRGAMEDYTQVLRLKPDDALAFHHRGVAKAGLGDYDGAMEDYTQALRLKPDDVLAFYNRGVAKAKLGDYRGAMEDYTEALRLKPDYADAFVNRGFAKFALGDYRGAMEDDTQVLRLKPDDAKTFYHRGVAKAKLGDYHGALEDYQQAKRLGRADLEGAIAELSEKVAKMNVASPTLITEAVSSAVEPPPIDPTLLKTVETALAKETVQLSEIVLSEKSMAELTAETETLNQKISDLTTRLRGTVRLSTRDRWLLTTQLKQTKQQQFILLQEIEIQRHPQLYAYYAAFQLYFTRLYLGAQVISSGLTELAEDEIDKGIHLFGRAVKAFPLVGHLAAAVLEAGCYVNDYLRAKALRKLTWLAPNVADAVNLFKETARLLTLAQKELLLETPEAPSSLGKLKEKMTATVGRFTEADFQTRAEKAALGQAKIIMDVILHGKQDKRGQVVRLTYDDPHPLTARELALILVEEADLSRVLSPGKSLSERVVTETSVDFSGGGGGSGGDEESALCLLSSAEVEATPEKTGRLLTVVGQFSGGGGGAGGVGSDDSVSYAKSESLAALEARLDNMQHTQTETLRRLDALGPGADLTVSGGGEAQLFQLPKKDPAVTSEIENLKKQVAEQQEAIRQLIAIVSTLRDEWHLTPVRAREERETDEERRDELFDVKPRMPDLR